jgi:hypothetical protein
MLTDVYGVCCTSEHGGFPDDASNRYHYISRRESRSLSFRALRRVNWKEIVGDLTIVYILSAKESSRTPSRELRPTSRATGNPPGQLAKREHGPLSRVRQRFAEHFDEKPGGELPCPLARLGAKAAQRFRLVQNPHDPLLIGEGRKRNCQPRKVR